MNIYAIAAEITKTAIENHAICFNDYVYENEEKTKKQNEFNAKQIADFYSVVYKSVMSLE